MHEVSHLGSGVDHRADFAKEAAIDGSMAGYGTLLDRGSANGSLSQTDASDRGSLSHAVPDPAVGMAFDSERAAFEYYNQYARKVGFSVRWDCKTVSRKTGLTIARLFVCSKQGYRGDGKIRDLFAKYHREDTRCGCPAFMKIKLAADDKFHISDCNTAHNHELATPHYVHMLRSQRPRSGGGSAQASASGKRKRKKKDPAAGVADDSGGGSEGLGMEVAAVSQSMGQQAVDGIDDGMMQLQVDCRNYLPTRRTTGLPKFDGHGLLEYFRNKQAQDPSLFYSFQFDVEEQIANIFWADGRMRVDFSHFGDVICFDTTYKMNDYGRPLALFLGVNHHKQLTVFGVALLYDETVDSFRWVFRTLLEAMGGSMPVTLLTDEGEAIAAAVAAELPYAAHRLCVWHLYQRALKNLAHIFSGAKSFDDDLGKCLFDCELEADLFEAWNAMLVKYGLFENTWLQHKFDERERWAAAYGRSTFCADIRSSQRAESLTRELRGCLQLPGGGGGGDGGVLRFFARFERFLEGKRRQELEANFRMTQSQPYVPPVSIIKHAARVYTSSVFYMFMAEYVVGLECLIKNEEVNGQVRVLTVEDGRRHEYLVRVDMEEQVFGCTCQRFEFAGVLCGHILACITDDLRAIPDRYVLKRWTRAAGEPPSGEAAPPPPHLHSRRYDLLVRGFVPALLKAAGDEDLYNCAVRHRLAMEEEMERIAGEKAPPSAAAPPAPGSSHYAEPRPRNIAGEISGEGSEQAIWVV